MFRRIIDPTAQRDADHHVARLFFDRPLSLRPMNRTDRILEARNRATRLLAVVAPHFPLDVSSTGRHDDWGVTGPAFIARATRLVQALSALPDDCESAAGLVARVLYEHVATFAWLAIDPGKHLPQWIRKDRVERLKVDNDMARFGRALLSQPIRNAFEAETDSISDAWPALPGMAEQADAHWSTRIKAFSTDVYGLRGMYVVMYRPLSALVHGMPESLRRVVRDGPRQGVLRVRVEEEADEHNAFTSAPFIYAFGLLVSSEANGFPERDRVNGAF